MLEVHDLVLKYGGVTAVSGCSFNIKKNEMVTLLGANGAGKSTTLCAISGLIKPSRGECISQGENLAKLSAEAIVSRGIVQVPEGRQIFTKLTVEENLRMGAFLQKDKTLIKRNYERAFFLFPVLQQRRKQSAGTLSGGEQQMLAIGRALMSNPKLLLLDEPSMGLSPLLTQQVFGALVDLQKEGMTILLVEQNAYDALRISNRAYIMETGKVIMEGKSSELLLDPRVKDAYLGGDL